MEDEIRKRIETTPSFVQDSIYEDYTTDAIIKIREGFLDNDGNRTETLKNIIGLIILKDIKIEQTSEAIKDAYGLDEKSTNEVALIILTEILFPIKDYFPGIEDEIVKLGGEVPKAKVATVDQQMLKREEEMEAMNEEKEKKETETEAEEDVVINLSIEELIKEYPQVESQAIGSQESIVVEGVSVPMKPIIKYWTKDYLEKMGYNEHSNLDRVQYVYHDKNTRNMNEEERRQLSLVLKSLDEGISLPYSTRLRKIDFSKIAEE